MSGPTKLAIYKLFRSQLMTCGRGTGPSLGNGLVLRPERLQKAQLSRTVRGVSPAKKRRANTTFTTDVISYGLRLSDGDNNSKIILPDGAIDLGITAKG
ncbi:hypothetical protein [Lactiplantibacillus xiangfangensis]|uniref:hypothetical protein n=1 Tax=Lactiplantibacillus xiangfangensis TaxID=942150 RepID=UPI000A784F7D